jgi:NADPH-dependent glutamate synthase beta subunit-like oxidoreductase/ferredoxin
MGWILGEYRSKGSIFGVPADTQYEKKVLLPIFGEKVEAPFGPAAGPNTQLAQNIVAAYVAGSRFFELKTVQVMDGAELAACVPKPCINAADECYNCEWSTELTVPQALSEYVKAWFACKLLAKELRLGDPGGFVFNMSVGYDLAGIKSPKIDSFIEGLKDASGTAAWQECIGWTLENLDKFSRVDEAYVKNISARVSSSITESTLHGCPPEEIERIAAYLIVEKGLHTYIKCNPTLLGYEYARQRLDSLGFGYVTFDDHHFREDLQWADAVPMFRRLSALCEEKGLEFGLKLTNTFPVDVAAGELPSQEMYMSGRALHALTIHAARRIAEEFGGRLRISFSGGADIYNIRELYDAGIWPINMATTVLKPGGYRRFGQMAFEFMEDEGGAFDGVSVEAVAALDEKAGADRHYRKPVKPLPNRKIGRTLPLVDCFTAPCRGGCPIGQDIPGYLRAVNEGRFADALEIILERNALPFITGTLCPHHCGDKCMRNHYESSVRIREAKLMAAEAAYDSLLPKMIKVGDALIAEAMAREEAARKDGLAGLTGEAGKAVMAGVEVFGSRADAPGWTETSGKESSDGITSTEEADRTEASGRTEASCAEAPSKESSDGITTAVPGKEERKVAVIGGGPAGLAAAYFLSRAGVDTTVFERRHQLGGVVRHAIPRFRISDEAIDKDVELCRAYGAKFRFGIEVGSVSILFEEGYTDVIVATGAWKPSLAGLKYGNEMDALYFLDLAKNYPQALSVGRNVAVIGGGNTAMDVARAAKRVDGVENVSLIYRRTRRYMPADEEELDDALAEGVVFRELLSPVGVRDGVLLCSVMEMGEPDASGRRSPVDTGRTVEIPADTVIAAVGEGIDTELYDECGAAVGRKGRPETDECMETSVPHVYAIGDARRGPATVVEAIADAAKAASAIAGISYETYAAANIDPDATKPRLKKGMVSVLDAGGMASVPDGGNMACMQDGGEMASAPDVVGMTCVPDGSVMTSASDGRGMARVQDGGGMANTPDGGVMTCVTDAGGDKGESKTTRPDSRCLGCPTVCEVCADVCPNRANVAIKVPGLAMEQIVHIDGMCNECGNCAVFCPYDGRPYRDKLTLFWSEEDFENSSNQGFLPLEGGDVRVRLAGTDGADPMVRDVKPGDGSLPEDISKIITAVLNDYPYLKKG